jgi:hypothetical protein
MSVSFLKEGGVLLACIERTNGIGTETEAPRPGLPLARFKGTNGIGTEADKQSPGLQARSPLQPSGILQWRHEINAVSHTEKKTELSPCNLWQKVHS